MAEPTSSHTTGSLAELVGGELRGPADVHIRGINALDIAGPDEITFISSRAFARQWARSRAGAALISRGLEAAGHDPAHRALIEVADAEAASIAVLEQFRPPPATPEVGVHATAWVHPSARLGDGVRVGPHVSVDRDAEIGDGVVLHAGVRIYAEAAIGAGSVLHANAVIRERCRLGRSVILHQGVSIGADGFGYHVAPDGRSLRKVPQIGWVEIGDEVEIGANACVDRGKFGATVVGAGTKIDNLVQIGHNCRIGRCAVIAGLTGVAGSVTIGDGARIAGMVGIADHLEVGEGATIGAKSGVTRDVPPGSTVYGYPADEATLALRQMAALRKLPGLIQRLSHRSKPDRG